MVSAMPSLTKEQTLEHVGELIGEHVVGQPLTDEVRNRINNRLNERYGAKPGGNRFYLQARNGSDSKHMAMGRYVNPKLALHSEFYGALDTMMKCAEAHAHIPAAEAEEQQVC